MCGIVGAWREGSDLTATVTAAVACLRHRGPNDAGVWRDAPSGAVLGHTRLAILDLSQAGHQPMASACGRFHMVYNGEIYNHLELRKQLADQPWRGHSDTETLLACFRAWGVARTLNATVGMFALALFDREARKLYLARDRFGEKPLYYGYAGGAFVFASELKALRGMPGFDAAVDRDALRAYMHFSYVPAPRSIYKALRKLPMGSWLELDADAARAGAYPEPQSYWSALAVARAGDAEVRDVGDAEAIRELERVLGDAVQCQMISDVPLGAFLSGGVDSSTVVALMQARSSRPVRTFSIGFDEHDFDESRQAGAVASHLKTEHTELIARPADMLGLVQDMPRVYDEPFADPSQLPACMVASLARKHVTVALSGDGGDEVFGGYNRYHLAARNWPRVQRVPRVVRHGIAAGLRAVSPRNWQRLADAYGRVSASGAPARMVGDKVHKVANVIGAKDEATLYNRLVTHSWPASVLVAHSGAAVPTAFPADSWSSLAQQMMAADAISYLPDDILVKVDRAAMASSLETRVPLLDHRVFEYAWRLPLRMKLREGTSKWLLRQVLYRHVPRELVERPKMGFAVPLADWLRGPLRGWAEELLTESRLRSEGFFDPAPIRRRWLEHLAGRNDWQYPLWTVLMFQAWQAEQCAAPLQ